MSTSSTTQRYLAQVEEHRARTTTTRSRSWSAEGDGAWVTDVDGRRYLDCLAAYSAVNFGHGHPVLVDAAKAQLDRITLTSRAFHNDQLGPFLEALASSAAKTWCCR